MRILHVIPTLDPATGGPTEVVRVLLNYGPEDYEQEVVTLDDPGAGFLREIEFPVHALGPRTSVYGRNRKLIPWLRASRERFDGVVVHGMWQYTGYSVWRAMRGRVPYMVFPHGMLDPYFKRTFPLKHLKKWLYWLPVEYWVLRGATRVLFTCGAEAESAKQSFWLHRWNARVVPFGTIPPAGDTEAQREAFFGACPAVRGRRFVLFLGRIDRKKGCDLLVDAFVKLAARDPGLDLVVAGPDPQNWRAELARGAEASGVAEHIHWPGMVRGDAKWGAFHAAEAFALPSHQENFGIAVAEALACGKPVLLSDKVNIAAEIAADGAGLMEPDTAAGTELLLKRWMEMPAAEREAMAARARDCFHQRYDMRENAKTVVRVFEKRL
ncbi:MAG: glycosyltransferase [Acidobacteriaceae bacterium]|jgi:glycosyltransferase involved in cell wall biosynthesis